MVYTGNGDGAWLQAVIVAELSINAKASVKVVHPFRHFFRIFKVSMAPLLANVITQSWQITIILQYILCTIHRKLSITHMLHFFHF